MQGSSARPREITTLALAGTLGCVVGLLRGLGTVSGAAGGLEMIIGLAFLVIGVAELAFAYLAWTLQPWGWQLGAGISVAFIVVALAHVLLIGSIITTAVIPIGVSAITLYYLMRPAVKAAFGRE